MEFSFLLLVRVYMVLERVSVKVVDSSNLSARSLD